MRPWIQHTHICTRTQTHILTHADTLIMTLREAMTSTKDKLLSNNTFFIAMNKFHYNPSKLHFDNLTINSNNLERGITAWGREATWTEGGAEQRFKHCLHDRPCLSETEMGEEELSSKSSPFLPCLWRTGFDNEPGGLLTRWGTVFGLVTAAVHLSLAFNTQLAITRHLNKIKQAC